jgi:hypothetical protein
MALFLWNPLSLPGSNFNTPGNWFPLDGGTPPPSAVDDVAFFISGGAPVTISQPATNGLNVVLGLLGNPTFSISSSLTTGGFLFLTPATMTIQSGGLLNAIP